MSERGDDVTAVKAGAQKTLLDRTLEVALSLGGLAVLIMISKIIWIPNPIDSRVVVGLALAAFLLPVIVLLLATIADRLKRLR
jgi:hypothetical protein